MSRLTKILVTILFPLALAAVPASILLPGEPVPIDNRPLARPELRLENLTRPRFYRQLFNYVRRGTPARGVLIKAGAGIDYWVFEDSPDPLRVFKGNSDWLYYRPTFEKPCSVAPSVVTANFVSFVRALERHADTVVVTVSPSKFVIHPEYLTAEQADYGRCAGAAGRELRQRLADSDLAHYVDGWELFEDLKAEGMQPYFRTDTHFNYEASIPWMRAIVEKIAPIWEESAVKDEGLVRYLGNLMSFIGLEETEVVRKVVVDRAVETGTEILRPRLRRHRSEGDLPLIGGTTLLIADSFIELPEPSLVQYFADITVADWRDPEAVEHFLSRVTDSDVIIVEVSELDIWDRFGDDHLAVALAELVQSGGRS